ncbi:MAG: glutamate-5-semialdehyde dehydrogenase [Lachnospiraceae bacterium]|nr:glutamate-5-semialdehyde dehydrogenase [Lachnospiraceae bacterium]
MTALEIQGEAAKKASRVLAVASTETKNKALKAIAEAISAGRDRWLKANATDIENAKKAGMRESLQDRLLLNDARVDGIVKSIDEIIALNDPIGEVLDTVTRPNGLNIEKRRVPIGVIGIIYEARPNVTVDAAVLTLKSGNATILRGGKEAINSNREVVKIMQEALVSAGLPAECISLVQDTSRDSATELMNLTDYVDVLIPRGGKGLIKSVVQNAKVPVIQTGDGVCHVYIDKDADLEMGAKILDNAKTSRPSVCNAAECALVHKDVLADFMKVAFPILKEKHVALRCDDESLNALGTHARDSAVTKAIPEDWDTEYGDFILAVKTVADVNEAIDFITEHGTMHSEAIVTENAETAAEFLNKVDAAAVYWNASTRFTDGGEFGLGAEIGISTQKMHARGPMGLTELTSYKYVVTGKGQIR